MKRMTVLVAVTMLFVTLANGDPALGGGRGLWRVQDARVEEDGALVFAGRWMFDRVKSEGRTIYRGPLMGLEMNYAPFPMLEVFGCFSGVLDISTEPSTIYYDWQGQQLGAKVSLPFIPVLKLAGSAHWAMEKDDYKYKAEFGYNDGLFSAGRSWRGIASLRFWELYKTLPTLMFNYGQTLDGGPQFGGVGLEMASDALDLFVEASSEIPSGAAFRDLWNNAVKARVAPGVRIKIPYFHITGGVELGLTDNVPDYQAILGFNIVSPFPKPAPRPWGRLAGKVIDARSRMPLAGAAISSPNGRFRRQQADENGIFFLQKAPVGVVVVEAAAEGYISEAVPLVINDKDYASYTFELKPLVPYGTVAGRVFDAYTNVPLEASISFIGTNVEPALSNDMTGFFRVDNVPAGLVNVQVERDGYFAEERVIEVEDGGLTKLNIGLSPLDMKGAFTGKVIDKKTGAALAATISFTDGRRTPLGTDAGTGEFAAELPVASYEVKVEAQGYLAQTSSFSVEKGETTSRVFEMVSKGMVLTLRGVYFEFAKATLRTESYAALLEAAQIMKENPDISVEIQGHTDNVGSDEYNQRLSERRAYAVVNFMVQHGGIDTRRLAARGYGEGQPVAPNDTDEGRQLNRRVDFVIQR
jgi:outer membrane protein OmpA-like peptidoglycan-associated protein